MSTSGSTVAGYVAWSAASSTGDDVWVAAATGLLNWCIKGVGRDVLFLVVFSISFAMAISSLVPRSFNKMRWIAGLLVRFLVCLRMAL